MSSISIVPYSPKTHASLLPAIADLHITTILHDNAVMRFHPPFTDAKRQKVLDFWKERLNSSAIEKGERVTILALSTATSPSKLPPQDQSPPDAEKSSSAYAGNVELAGVVELLTPSTALDTGPFRAEVEMLMVHPSHRRGGLARRLMITLEQLALEKGRTQLTLGTTRGSAAETHFYPRMGYVKFGVLPEYGIAPDAKEDGRGGKERVDGVYFYKDLRKEGMMDRS